MSGTAVQSRFLTLDQVAEDLQLSRRTIERLVAAEILPSVRVGGSRRVAATELDEWIAGASLSSRPQTPAALVRDPDPAGSRSRTEREGDER
jgi:excisionase family DNA binding protein